jgi:hypothetical protein
MGKLLFGAAMAAVLLVAATSRSDVATDPTSGAAGAGADSPTTAVDEPTMDTPVAVAPGSEGPGHAPFTPYDVGGPDAIWTRADLSPAEQAVADRGVDPKGWQATHDAFASAVAERSQQAAADAAQHQLGVVEELAGTGVVP